MAIECGGGRESLFKEIENKMAMDGVPSLSADRQMLRRKSCSLIGANCDVL